MSLQCFYFNFEDEEILAEMADDSFLMGKEIISS